MSPYLVAQGRRILERHQQGVKKGRQIGVKSVWKFISNETVILCVAVDYSHQQQQCRDRNDSVLVSYMSLYVMVAQALNNIVEVVILKKWFKNMKHSG